MSLNLAERSIMVLLPSNPNTATDTKLLPTLAHWMAGDFSNQKQVFAEPTKFAHIRIFFRPLPYDFFHGIGFYSEQAYNHDLWTPYRQGMHRLVDRGDFVYIENYGFKDPVVFAGASRDRSILDSITRDDIERRHGCSMVFERQDDRLIGKVEPGCRCLIHRNGAQTYLVSEVELTETTWVSRDRGLDVETHEQVWGSAEGLLRFEKRASFSTEIPVDAF
ncbi:chromophore lyase CpcT/CpeT [Synechococcus sp. PCC 7336]|uniref:chromophore lyase CpcT/CpeT n=1 Tax=Synechococcus sp. PCC 7336 TaxID=195250 RepID=UPI00037A23CB|nr:chromophore lyase CpcT/CpeT [Synechococcus sp. PCC 7336]